MKLYQFAFVPFALLAACGGDSSITIVGQTPAAQATATADAQCDLQVRCGEAQVDITFENDVLVCTASIEDVAYQACFDDTEPEMLEFFENCELSAEDEQAIEDCFNASADVPCVTQAQLDTYCEEYEAGNEPEYPVEIPAECDAYFAIIERCSSPA
jgi:hypothetical protein